jgi:hypothetical protein
MYFAKQQRRHKPLPMRCALPLRSRWTCEGNFGALTNRLAHHAIAKKSDEPERDAVMQD